MKATIGSDETLKGDTFGGIVVCAAYFSRDEIDLHDSKRYTDNKIIQIAEELLAKYLNRFSLRELEPLQYNELIVALGNQTAVLNKLHSEVGKELKEKFSAQHIVDEYPGCTAGDMSVKKAEDEYVSVAAASIVARYYGLKQFERLSEQAGFVLPKGSTHVAQALEKIKSLSYSFSDYVKTHFSNVKKMMKN